MKKVLIISTSIRAGSNSEALAHAFEKGAVEAGNDVEFVSLKDKQIAFCKGCLACQKIGKCVIVDDANAIADKMCAAEVIVWVTPIYYYEMSGQMKTLIDRANSLYSRDYKFRDVYLLMTAAEGEDYVPEKAIGGVQGWIDCFEKATLKGTLFAGGFGAPNEIKDNAILRKAEIMGRGV